MSAWRISISRFPYWKYFALLGLDSVRFGRICRCLTFLNFLACSDVYICFHEFFAKTEKGKSMQSIVLVDSVYVCKGQCSFRNLRFIFRHLIPKGQDSCKSSGTVEYIRACTNICPRTCSSSTDGRLYQSFKGWCLLIVTRLYSLATYKESSFVTIAVIRVGFHQTFLRVELPPEREEPALIRSHLPW